MTRVDHVEAAVAAGRGEGDDGGKSAVRRRSGRRRGDEERTARHRPVRASGAAPTPAHRSADTRRAYLEGAATTWRREAPSPRRRPKPRPTPPPAVLPSPTKRCPRASTTWTAGR